jgi:hypothetical protein
MEAIGHLFSNRLKESLSCLEEGYEGYKKILLINNIGPTNNTQINEANVNNTKNAIIICKSIISSKNTSPSKTIDNSLLLEIKAVLKPYIPFVRAKNNEEFLDENSDPSTILLKYKCSTDTYSKSGIFKFVNNKGVILFQYYR